MSNKRICVVILLIAAVVTVWDGLARQCVVRYCETSPLLCPSGVYGLQSRARSFIERLSFAWVRATSPKFVAYFELLLLLRHTLLTQKKFGVVWDDPPLDDIVEHVEAELGIKRPDPSKIYPLLFYRWARSNLDRLPRFIRKKIADILSQIARAL